MPRLLLFASGIVAPSLAFVAHGELADASAGTNDDGGVSAHE